MEEFSLTAARTGRSTRAALTTVASVAASIGAGGVDNAEQGKDGTCRQQFDLLRVELSKA
ncbi:MAG: hypothetical protein M3319_09165 [Actinomycetota bacterium]|nr:hypothetical protein [Actinomycetota bacterium]MDQ3900595.1 hypothetical protein [Actinomycetota bacterium]